MKALLKIEGNPVFAVSTVGHKKLPIPSPISVDFYLENFVDLNGGLSKLDMLRLRDLLTPEEYQRVQKSTESFTSDKTVHDIIDVLDAAKVEATLDLLVNLDKRIEVAQD
jgi:hypothetical protein